MRSGVDRDHNNFVQKKMSIGKNIRKSEQRPQIPCLSAINIERALLVDQIYFFPSTIEIKKKYMKKNKNEFK